MQALLFGRIPQGGDGMGMPPMGGAGGMGMGGGMQMPAQPQPQPGQLNVKPEEMEAIVRLQSLGFSQAAAAQAYFACDKNEEFAANFLFMEADQDDAFNQNAAIQNSMNPGQNNQGGNNNNNNQGNGNNNNDGGNADGGDKSAFEWSELREKE